MNHYESFLAISHHADPPVVAPLRQRLRVALATAELVAAHRGHPKGFQRQSKRQRVVVRSRVETEET